MVQKKYGKELLMGPSIFAVVNGKIEKVDGCNGRSLAHFYVFQGYLKFKEKQLGSY